MQLEKGLMNDLRVKKTRKNIFDGQGVVIATSISLLELRRNGANARMHAAYVKNPSTSVSWHYTVDDEQIIYQHLPTNEIGWHAGDGGTGQGNRESIGIEICVNSDGQFAKAREWKYGAMSRRKETECLVHKHTSRQCPP